LVVGLSLGVTVGLNVKGKSVHFMKDLRAGALFQVNNAKLVNNSPNAATPNYTLDPDNFGQGNVKVFRKESFDGIPLSALYKKTVEPPADATTITSSLGILFQYRMLDNGEVQYLLVNRSVTDPVVLQSRFPKPEYKNLVGQFVIVHNMRLFPDGNLKAASGFRVERVDPHWDSPTGRTAKAQLEWFADNKADLETSVESAMAPGFVPPTATAEEVTVYED